MRYNISKSYAQCGKVVNNRFSLIINELDQLST